MVKKSNKVAMVACISSGIIFIISDKFNTSQICQTFLESTIEFMNIPYELYHSPENGFVNSRSALKNLLKKENFEVLDLQNDLQLNNFRELKNYPDFYTSLSHTKELGAALLIKKSQVLAAGIDIEWSERILKEGTEKFYVNPHDQHQLLPIEIWTAKEAAFKALSPLHIFPGVLVLSKIIIKGETFTTLETPQLIGKFQVLELSANNKMLVCSIAFIPNP
jgi:phosphopantetheinyl transferase (holo-ACP synthase)